VGRANEPPEEDQGGDQDQAEDLVAAEEAGLGFAAGGFRQVLLVRFDETLSHESNRKLRHSIGEAENEAEEDGMQLAGFWAILRKSPGRCTLRRPPHKGKGVRKIWIQATALFGLAIAAGLPDAGGIRLQSRLSQTSWRYASLTLQAE
jgi:hypothetical protein